MDSVSKALQNELILSAIYKKLDIRQQKQFRLVSKAWRNTTVDQLRKSVVIPLFMHDVRWSRYGRSVTEFMEICKGGEYEAFRIDELPFRRFRLFHGGRTLDIRIQDFPMFNQFWEVVLPNIEHLELVGLCTNEYVIDFFRWLLLEGNKNQLKSLKLSDCLFLHKTAIDAGSIKKLNPNLKAVATKLTTLTIFNTKFTVDYNSPSQGLKPEHIRELLEIMPNLKELSVDGRNSKSVTEVISVPANTGKKYLDLEALHIEIDSVRTEQETLRFAFEYVQAAQPKLKKVEIECTRSHQLREAPMYFHQFINYCSSSLTKLEVEMKVLEDPWITDFSGRVFPYLTDFRLSLDWDFDREDAAKFDFNALHGMPKLKRFLCKRTSGGSRLVDLSENELSYTGKTKWMGNENLASNYSNFQFENLEEFHFEMIRNFTAGSLRRMASCTRNVKSVSLILSQETFEVALDLWPKLRDLTVLDRSTVPYRFACGTEGKVTFQIICKMLVYPTYSARQDTDDEEADNRSDDSY